jgi:hypothetical protein
MLNKFRKNDGTPNFLGSKAHNGLVVSNITRSEPLVANFHRFFTIRIWGSGYQSNAFPKRNNFDSAQHQLTTRTNRSQQIYRGGAKRLARGRRKFTEMAPALLVATKSVRAWSTRPKLLRNSSDRTTCAGALMLRRLVQRSQTRACAGAT